MQENHRDEIIHIRPEMTILEIVHKYRQTQDVFKKYSEQSGQCIMCTALFESLTTVCERFGLNLEKLLEELESVV